MGLKSVDEIVEHLLSGKIDTKTYYRKNQDEFVEEREVLHDSIIDSFLATGTPSENKKAFFLGGAPGSGKSTLLTINSANYPPGCVIINPDAIRALLPEYQHLLGKKDLRAADLVHEESSYLGRRLIQEAIDLEFNIIIDKVSNDDYGTRKSEAELFRNNGYWLRMDYVFLETELGLQLNKERAKVTGRIVPASVIRKTNKAIAVMFPQLIDDPLYDELYLWNTTAINNPVLVLSQKNGNLDVRNRSLFDTFLNKKNE